MPPRKASVEAAKREAKATIDQIRRQVSSVLHGGDTYGADMIRRMLPTYYDTLYSETAHFLSELIQNADDNEYNAIDTPSLVIIYRADGYLWFGCNEVGFTEENVRAICTVADSTKAREGSDQHYIGEKGIGFKSVFKAADFVWIRSEPYEFGFDRNQRLGIITPEWQAFPSHEKMKHCQTAFCLRIPDHEHRRVVRQSVYELAAPLLLFLRKIQTIDLHIESSSGRLERQFQLGWDDGADDLEHIGFDATSLETRGIQYMVVTRHPQHPPGERETQRYLVTQREIHMPHHLRAGIDTTVVSLAFPIKNPKVGGSMEPERSKCHTFSFLPVRDYGIPFILQGDFLLAAGREDILAHHAWNQAIVAAGVDLFVEAVHAFNKSGILKYTWPRYIKHAHIPKDTALSSFMMDVKQRLAQEDVMVTPDGEMRKPCTVRYLSEMFWHERDGSLLLTGSDGASGFVSNRYSQDDTAALDIAAVSPEEFVDMLRAFVTDEPRHFREKSPGWHSQLARAVMDADMADRVADLRIVPLEGDGGELGHWVTASSPADEKIYLPYRSGPSPSLPLPTGIDAAVVARAAAKDKHRKALYKQLGAKVLSPRAACDLVVRSHSALGDDIESENMTLEHIMSHAWFLFELSGEYRIFHLEQVRLVTACGQLHPGHDLYMDDPKSNIKLTDIVRPDAPMRFLHPDYLVYAPIDKRDEWLLWLQESLGVRTWPPLIGKDGSLSADLHGILNGPSGRPWLHLLRHYWDRYHAEISFSKNSGVRKAISGAPIACRDGQARPLRDVYFPTVEVLGEPFAAEIAPVLDIDSTTADEWAALDAVLNLRLVPDGDLYLILLNRFQTDRSIRYAHNDVRSLYRKVCHCLDKGSEPNIKGAFEHDTLVYISKGAKWVNISTCRWNAPSVLQQVTALEPLYSQHTVYKRLFVDHLGVQDAGIEDFVAALTALHRKAERVGEIKALLLALGDAIARRRSSSATATVLEIDRSLAVIPIDSGTDQLRSIQSRTWFIADDLRLGRSFSGKVALLDLPSAGVERARPLFEEIQLDNRYLSFCVEKSTEIEGAGAVSEGFTLELRAKADFIACLADDTRSDEVRNQLVSCEVALFAAIVLHQWVNVDGNKIVGKKDTEFVTVLPQKDPLVVALSRDTKDRLPPTELGERLRSRLELPSHRWNLLQTILGNDVRNPAQHRQTVDALERGGIFIPAHVQNYQSFKRDLFSSNRTSEIHLPGASGSDCAPSPSPVKERMPSISVAHKVLQVRIGEIRAAAKRFVEGDLHIVLPSTHKNATSNQGLREDDTDDDDDDDDDEEEGGSECVDEDDEDDGSREGSESLEDDSDNVDDVYESLLDDESGICEEPGTLDGIEDDVAGLNLNEGPSSWQYGGSPLHAQTYKKQIGNAGEYMVYLWLKDRFGISDECWTSQGRTSHGLPAFTGGEGNYTDFTVPKRIPLVRDFYGNIDRHSRVSRAESAMSRKITEWLIRNGWDMGHYTRTRPLTYHFEVKTTLTARSDRFTVSAGQYRRARQCHESRDQVFVLLRIYDLEDRPRCRAYVDPYGLRKTGRLQFTPGPVTAKWSEGRNEM